MTMFIVALANKTWESISVEIPAGAIPDKFVVGSAKWSKKAVAWYREMHPNDDQVYVGILEAPSLRSIT